MRDLVSVIIATYYRNEALHEAIESVLQQDYRPVELIVVDDSGEKHARPVLQQYGSVTPIFRESNGGWGAAYTTGVRASQGRYIQFLDDDDLLLEGRLTQTVRALQQHSDAGVAYSGLIKDPGEHHLPKPHVTGNILTEALRFKTFPCCTLTMLMERDVLQETLPLASYGDDNDLKIELARRTQFTSVNEALAHWRTEKSRKWVGLKKYAEIKRIVRNQTSLFDQYPSIRRSLLAETFEDEGRERLRRQGWSVRGTWCFLQAARYAEDQTLRHVAQVLASLLGRPGWEKAQQARRFIGRLLKPSRPT